MHTATWRYTDDCAPEDDYVIEVFKDVYLSSECSKLIVDIKSNIIWPNGIDILIVYDDRR